MNTFLKTMDTKINQQLQKNQKQSQKGIILAEIRKKIIPTTNSTRKKKIPHFRKQKKEKGALYNKMYILREDETNSTDGLSAIL